MGAGKAIGLVAAGAVAASIGGLVLWRLLDTPAGADVRRPTGERLTPVETAPVELGPMERRRIFSGTLEASRRIAVASNVAGRIASVAVDLADPVEPGDVVAILDDAAFRQEVAGAEAELAVTRAAVARAEATREFARRDLALKRSMTDRGVATPIELDEAETAWLAAVADVQAAEAGVASAEAVLEAARVQLGFTVIRAGDGTADADGTDGGTVAEDEDPPRLFVADRLVEPGDTVSANTPLMELVGLDPIDAVIAVTERDYASLAAGQPVRLTTDAFPGRSWVGEVTRVAPVFAAGSRQARVEIRAANGSLELRPGMFVRADAVLGRRASAVSAPAEAVARRDGRDVIFVVVEADGADGPARVEMRTVEIGIRSDGRVELVGADAAAWVGRRVVTLGQQLIEDGAGISIPADEADPVERGRAAAATGGVAP